MSLRTTRTRRALLALPLVLGLSACQRTLPTAVIADPAMAAAFSPDGGTCMPLPARFDGQIGHAPEMSSGCSTSVDGAALTPTWTLLDQPSGSMASIFDAHGRTPTFIPDVAGDYVVQLTVNDGQATSAPATVTVRVGGCGTVPPVAMPSATPATPGVGTAVQLDVATTDADTEAECSAHPATFTWQWTMVSQPTGSTAALNDASARAPSFVADLPGTYVARVVSTDPLGFASQPADVTVTVAECGGRAPALSAAAATPTAAPAVGQSVSLGVSVLDADTEAGCAAHDAVFSYAWTLESLPLGSAAAINDAAASNPSITPDVPGAYVARVVVTDPTGRSATTTVSLTASECGANAPTVLASASAPTTSVGRGVQLRATGADADNDAACGLTQRLDYAWHLVEVPAGSLAVINGAEGPTASINPDVAGVYAAEVVVMDSTGRRSDARRVSFTADACGTAAPIAVSRITGPGTPVVCDGSRVTIDFAGTSDTVQFDAVDSHDPDNDSCSAGQNLFYEWSIYTTPRFNTGSLRPSTTGRTVNLQVGGNGEYRVRLVVRDSTGRISNDAICYVNLTNVRG